MGRNGSGKSTLMKLMAGLVEADAGERVLPPGVTAGYMEQDPDLSGFATLGDFAASGLEPGEEYRVAQAAEGLKFDPGGGSRDGFGRGAAAGGAGQADGRGARADAS